MPHQTPLFDRSDTLFGVCEGLGRDFGFHPNILRIAFGVGLMWNPVFVIGTYVALGVAVYAARFLFPAVQPASASLVAVADTGASDDARDVTEDRLAA